MIALPPAEASLLAALTDAADRGLSCPTNEELSDMLGLSALSAPPQIMDRLRRRGLIEVQRYQKERRVKIVATGNQTAEVRTPAPHWRDRPRDVPAPAVHAVRAQRPDTARDIMTTAQKLGRAPSDFLADLVWIGWAAWQEAAIQPGASEGLG